jgi:ankyrin repeat protein
MSEKMPISQDNSEQTQEINPNELKRQFNHTIQKGTKDELFAMFDNGMGIDQVDYDNRTALQPMSFKGNKEIVEELIARGANVNHIMNYQERIPMTALDAARQARKTEIVNILIAHGAKTGKELTQS